MKRIVVASLLLAPCMQHAAPSKDNLITQVKRAIASDQETITGLQQRRWRTCEVGGALDKDAEKRINLLKAHQQALLSFFMDAKEKLPVLVQDVKSAPQKAKDLRAAVVNKYTDVVAAVKEMFDLSSLDRALVGGADFKGLSLLASEASIGYDRIASNASPLKTLKIECTTVTGQISDASKDKINQLRGWNDALGLLEVQLEQVFIPGLIGLQQMLEGVVQKVTAWESKHLNTDTLEDLTPEDYKKGQALVKQVKNMLTQVNGLLGQLEKIK